MRHFKRAGMMLVLMLCMVISSHTKAKAEDNNANFKRDYISKVYTSENGIEGTAVKSIYSAKDGFIWIGGYTGLYRYDGTEFKKYLINNRSLTINEIAGDKNGDLWIGTNGNGLYCYDGKKFEQYKFLKEDGDDIINRLWIDAEQNLFVATKNGLLSMSLTQKTQKMYRYPELSGMTLRDICELKTGEKVVIEKTGRIFLVKGHQVKELNVSVDGQECIARTVTQGRDGAIYIGTLENKILKTDKSGKVLSVINAGKLSSINDIYEFEKGRFWVCSDTGIGILSDNQVTKMDYDIDDSVEEVCTDYQGNYWFTSSRQGVLQVYKNNFWNLGKYWGITGAVNTICKYGDKTYVGTDNGLYCTRKDRLIKDSLVEECKGKRIRQIYEDEDKNLWISTYQDGIKLYRSDGRIETYDRKNSGITTDQIRCIWQNKDKSILIGTEEGLFVLKNHKIQRYVKDEILNAKRILDIKDQNGTIYVGTDGYGVWQLKDHKVEKVYSKKQGMLSSVVMKVVPSKKMNGIWLITGEEICFIDKDQKIKTVKGIPFANSLDLLLTDYDTALILAGDGMYEVKEQDMLKESPQYMHLSKRDGIPVDFTANAGNMIKDNMLYMCGTTGLAAAKLNRKWIRHPVKVYLNAVTADGKTISVKDGKVSLPANTSRVNIDVRPIDYSRQHLYTSYCLEGMEKKRTFITQDDKQKVSYTNLKGGNYTYDYQVLDIDKTKCVARMKIKIHKDYSFMEEPKIRQLLIFIIAAVLVLGNLLILAGREKAVKSHYRAKFKKEKEQEIEKLAYTDLLTGAYNRNWFEHKKAEINMENLYAFFSVSINQMKYIKTKHGNKAFENVLVMAADILKQCNPDDTAIYRISENGFYFWFERPVNLENYILKIKEAFRQKGEEEHMPLSFAVGAVYNNMVDKEKIDDLIERCEKMRLLDKKQADARFIEEKMKLL